MLKLYLIYSYIYIYNILNIIQHTYSYSQPHVWSLYYDSPVFLLLQGQIMLLCTSKYSSQLKFKAKSKHGSYKGQCCGVARKSIHYGRRKDNTVIHYGCWLLSQFLCFLCSILVMTEVSCRGWSNCPVGET